MQSHSIRHIYELSEPQGHRCCYCGHRMIKHTHQDGVPMPRNAMTKDHLEPRVYGGPTEKRNLVAACYQCNNLRGEIDAYTFYNLVQRWFKRDQTLWARWHALSRETRRELKEYCHAVHERQLAGQARRYLEPAFRHSDFTRRRQESKLRWLAWIDTRPEPHTFRA